MRNKSLAEFTVGYNEEKFDNSFLSSWKKYEINEEAMDEISLSPIISNAKRTVRNFLSKDNKVIPKRVGLMVGQVQSGKTKAFLATIASAFDTAYDCAIVLCASDTPLLDQTEQRIKQTFSDKYFSDKKIDFNRIDSDVKVENAVKKLKSELYSEHKFIFYSLKQTVWLDKLNKTFKELESADGKKINILIIDDEGDQASLNNENKKKDNDSIDDATAINKAIRKLLDLNKSSSFLTVTATPYANLVAREATDLSPDFSVVIKPGNNYKGLDYYHNGDYKLIYEIPQLDKIEEIVEDITNGALPTFMVGNALIRSNPELEGNSNRKFEFLVHALRGNPSNRDLVNMLTEKIKKIQAYSSAETKSLEYNNYFLKDFIEKGLSFIGINKNDLTKQLFEDVVNDVRLRLDVINIIPLFGPEKIEYNPNDYSHDVILLGAKLVERGVTFKNLRTTYMGFLAVKPQGDTILQRARWFGYRKDSDFNAVFMPRLSKNFYEQLRDGQEELYDELRTPEGLQNIVENGFPFPLNPARRTVNIEARYTTISHNSYTQSEIDYRYDQYEKECDLVQELINDNFDSIQNYGYSGTDWGHKFIRLTISDLFEKYPDFCYFVFNKSTNNLEGNTDLEKIRQEYEELGVREIHIMLPSWKIEKYPIWKDSKNRRRKLYNNSPDKTNLDLRISLFQGRDSNEDMQTNTLRPHDKKVLEKYCYLNGERKIIMQIQIHKLDIYKQGTELKEKWNAKDTINVYAKKIFYSTLVENINNREGIKK